MERKEWIKANATYLRWEIVGPGDGIRSEWALVPLTETFEQWDGTEYKGEYVYGSKGQKIPLPEGLL